MQIYTEAKERWTFKEDSVLQCTRSQTSPTSENLLRRSKNELKQLLEIEESNESIEFLIIKELIPTHCEEHMGMELPSFFMIMDACG